MKTLGIDFDGTLCKKQPYGDGTIWQEPNEGAAEAMKLLKKEGYRLVVFTVRLSPNMKGIVEIKKDRICNWLNKYGIPYDEVTNNKPSAVAYVDDRAIRFTDWADITNYFCQ